MTKEILLVTALLQFSYKPQSGLTCKSWGVSKILSVQRCICSKILGVIFGYSHNRQKFLRSLSRKEPNARHRPHDSNKALLVSCYCNITRSLYSRRCCLYAVNSGMGQLALHAHTQQRRIPPLKQIPILFLICR